MALDVWIGYPTRHKGGPTASFDPEAYYVFLYPLFERFAEQHGKMIDPYDGVAFEGGELAHVLELVESARALIELQSEEFDVHMGTNMGSYFEPKNEEIHHRVNRADYLVFISKFEFAVLEAQRSNKPLVFFGD